MVAIAQKQEQLITGTGFYYANKTYSQDLIFSEKYKRNQSYTIGIEHFAALNKNVFLNAGLQYCYTKYNRIDKNPCVDCVQSIQNSYLDFPIQLGFMPLKSKHINIFLKGGMAMGWLIEPKYNYQNPDINNFARTNQSALLEADISLRIKGNTFLNIGSGLRRFFNPVELDYLKKEKNIYYIKVGVMHTTWSH